jgi:hypothetical protein
MAVAMCLRNYAEKKIGVAGREDRDQEQRKFMKSENGKGRGIPHSSHIIVYFHLQRLKELVDQEGSDRVEKR